MWRFALALVVAAGCQQDVEIRACNDTGATVTNVKWSSFEEPSLAAGECSAYRVAEGDVYRYTFVELVLAGQTYTARPIDYVGETPLEGGRWSYHVTVPDPSRPFAQTEITHD